jgi:hypothetical protein
MVLLAGTAKADELKDRLEALRGGAGPARVVTERPVAEKSKAPNAPAVAPPAQVEKASAPVAKLAEDEKIAVLPVASEPDPEPATAAGTVDLLTLSAYVWRGQVLNNEMVAQPAGTVTKGRLSFNVWGNFNLTDVTTEQPEFTEIDLTLIWSGKAGHMGYSAGVVEYLFPHQTVMTEEEVIVNGQASVQQRGIAYPGTREITVGVSLPDLPVAPTVTLYYDVDEANSLYAIVSAGWSQKFIKEAVTVSLNVSAAYAMEDYNAFYFGVEQAGWNDLATGLTATFAPVEWLSVTPSVQYVMLLDDDIRDGAEGIYADKDQVVWGVKLSVAF